METKLYTLQQTVSQLVIEMFPEQVKLLEPLEHG